MTDGELIVVAGASRQGKTAWTMQQTRADPRLLVWDPKGTWEQVRCRLARAPAQWRKLIATPADIRAVLCSPYREDFRAWATSSFASGHWASIEGRPTTIVCEETAGVTHPGKAPPGWHRLLSQGLELGITIYAVTQAPAESDKTALRNASWVISFALRLRSDCEMMAQYLDCSPDTLSALRPLEFLGRDMRTGEKERATVRF